MRTRLLLLVSIALVSVAAGVLMATRFTPASASDQATITMHFSHFTPAVVTVPAGVPVTFVLQNQDPIDHEWIVGTSQVHDRHGLGTEPYHDSVPTEVTVPALSIRTTTVHFDRPGEYAFVCHLPGHEVYGMRGIVRVR